MPSESYLEHGSDEKYVQLLCRLNEAESFKGENKSVNMLGMLQTLKNIMIGLRKKHERISSQNTQMEQQSLQLQGLRSESSSLPLDMFVMCSNSIASGGLQLNNSINSFAGNRVTAIENYKKITFQMNDIFICPIDANLKQNIDEASHKISSLLTFVKNLNSHALDILSTQTRYMNIQIQLISSVNS